MQKSINIDNIKYEENFIHEPATDWDNILSNLSSNEANSEEHDEINYREKIIQFYKPYGINLNKLSFNKEYFFSHYAKDYATPDITKVSPSLITLINRFNTRFRTEFTSYPLWFAVCFPDVTYWGLTEGLLQIERVFSNTHASETNIRYGNFHLISDDLTIKYLKIILNEYLKATNKKVELS